jgi:amphi-Trp domain-containing protein
MPDVEIKRKVRLSRAEAGERLIALGTALTEGSRSEVDFDGGSIRFTVGDQVEWEFELEVDGDETELEIELKWTDSRTADAPAAKAPAAKAPAAARNGRGSRSRTRT